MASQNDQFTNQARQVLQNSQELVRSHRHNQLDVEHILLALLELEEGVPSRILAELGAPSNDIRAALYKTLESAPKLAYEASQIYLTPRAQRLLENAKSEAARLNDEFTGADICSSPPSWSLTALPQGCSGPTALTARGSTGL